MRAPRHPAPLILGVGLVAGSLDIGYNLILNYFRAITPAMVFRFISSGLLGTQRAIHDGAAAVALGVAMHFAIALAWTAAFYFLARRWAAIGRRPVVSGLAYGIAVWLIMNFLAVPLSRVPQRPITATWGTLFNSVLPVVIWIGLTVSLLFSRLPLTGRGDRRARYAP